VYICPVIVDVVSEYVLIFYLSEYLHIQTPHRQVQGKYTQTDNIPPQNEIGWSMQTDK